MSSLLKTMTRRRFIGTAAGGTAAVAAGSMLAGRPAVAGGHLPKVDPNDSQAKSLKYVHESTVDGQNCFNCQLYKGGTSAWGECAIFPGKEVAGKGWCSAWVKKES